MTTAHAYRSLSPGKLEEVFSQFLIDSWSYSKVTSFARNEKAFEMTYVYNYRLKQSSSTIAGQAYHEALDKYFSGLKYGEDLDMAALEMIAHEYILDIPANGWKLGKTTPTVEKCQEKALVTASVLLRNFMRESRIYLDDIDEVIDVESRCDAFITVNGVDIPLPCHSKIDLVVRTKSGKIAIIDHKSKTTFTDEEELALTSGLQAIIYVKVYEDHSGLQVDEVWFVENKISQNKDKAPQLNAFKIQATDDTRRLYEALLYEPLRRMLEAVHDPDYVYLINDSDNYVDKAELYEFWAKTMIAEVEEFNIVEAKKDLVSKRLKKIRDSSIAMVNPRVIKEFRNNAASFIQYDLSDKNMTQQEKIEHILRSFGVIVRVAHTFEGYSSNTFLLEVSAGVKISNIHSHRLDIANVLDVPSIRISRDLVVHDGRSYVAIEFSKKRDRVLEFDPGARSGMKLPLGKDNYNRTIFWDLDNPSTPHMLVCGATGSGKSVLLKCNIEYASQAGVKDIIILDPKYEFTGNYTTGIKVINDIIDIETEMARLVAEMNTRVKERISYKTLIIFDEFADAVAGSRKGTQLNVYEDRVVGVAANGNVKTKREVVDTLKSLEENLKILLQKGRSSGFRIVAGTQRASVKVITGDAKVNFPVQVCFRVPKETDSRVVLDEPGAESLQGAGDGLIKSPEYPDTVRFQGYYLP